MVASEDIPSSVQLGSRAEFIISFIDLSQGYGIINEDLFKSVVYLERYYKLVRLDEAPGLISEGIDYIKTERFWNYENGYREWGFHQPYFRVRYSIPSYYANDKIKLRFKLANTTTIKNGFGTALSKEIEIDNETVANGLRAIGLTPTDSTRLLKLDSNDYTYLDLLNERPIFVRYNDSPKLALLRNIYSAMGADMKIQPGILNTSYDLRMHAAQRAFAIRVKIGNADGMDGETWANLELTLKGLGSNYSYFDRSAFVTEYNFQVRRLYLAALDLYESNCGLPELVNIMVEKPHLGTWSTGLQVTRLQMILRGLGLLIDDRKFGSYDNWQTSCAVKALQSMCGLSEDYDVNYTDWTGFISFIEDYANKTDDEKRSIRERLNTIQSDRINSEVDSRLVINLDTSVASDGTVSINASCADSDKITISISNSNGVVYSNNITDNITDTQSVDEQQQIMSVTGEVYGAGTGIGTGIDADIGVLPDAGTESGSTSESISVASSVYNSGDNSVAAMSTQEQVNSIANIRALADESSSDLNLTGSNEIVSGNSSDNLSEYSLSGQNGVTVTGARSSSSDDILYLRVKSSFPI